MCQCIGKSVIYFKTKMCTCTFVLLLSFVCVLYISANKNTFL